MKNADQNTLHQMLLSFQAKHGRKPEKIVIAGIALVGLALRKELGPEIDGVKIESRLFLASEITLDSAKAKNLGIFVQEKGKNLRFRACDIA